MKYWRTPLDKDKVRPIKGRVEVLPERCKGCGFCIQYCPRHALEESTEMNQKGYHFPFAAKPDECTGCGLCEALCPDFAINAYVEEEKGAARV